MKFKLKWMLDGEARYYLGLARGMGLARHGILYTYTYITFISHQKQASKSLLFPPLSLPLSYIKKGEEEEFSSSISHHPKILGNIPAPTQGL